MRFYNILRLPLLTLVALVLSSVFSPTSFAQKIKVGEAIYRSSDDSMLTIKKITLLPVLDNVDGIYSRPAEKHLLKLLKSNHHWDTVESGVVGAILSPDDLESSPAKVRQQYQNTDADAIISSRVTKGPNGISIKVNMFLSHDGKLLAQEVAEGFKRFEVDAVNKKASELLQEVLKKIPYTGLVLSRQGNRVTVNLGKRDGISKDQVVTVVQIIKALRHPKFGFLINTEKEILGKVKLLKIDSTLSFGKIITEKEANSIQKDSKISGIDFVKYNNIDSLTENTSEQDALMQRPDGKISFGKKAESWVPKKPPTFGQVGAYLGLGNYSSSLTSSNASSFIYPSIDLQGELWMTSKWSLHGNMKQAIISTSGPSMNVSVSDFEFLMGYNFRMHETIWGPSVEVLGGYSTYTARTDSDSFPTTKYSGLKFGLQGGYPVTKDQLWRAGARLFFHYNPSMSETPSTGRGVDGSTINLFGLDVSRRVGMNMKISGRFDYELFSTSFNGAGTAGVSSSSQKHMNFGAGIHYMF